MNFTVKRGRIDVLTNLSFVFKEPTLDEIPYGCHARKLPHEDFWSIVGWKPFAEQVRDFTFKVTGHVDRRPS